MIILDSSTCRLQGYLQKPPKSLVMLQEAAEVGTRPALALDSAKAH